MVIDLEHHLQPYEIWKKRGGKKGEIVWQRDANGVVIRPLDNATYDVQIHLKNMDAAGIDMAVLSAPTADSLEEAKVFNNHFAELSREYPKRFAGLASTLPLGGKPALEELERAIKDLHLKGVLMSGHVEGRSIDSRELWPFYKKMSEMDAAIFVHPSLAVPGFDACKAPYELNRTIAREFDLALATIRLCLGGVLEEFPNLKFIIAHFGGGISSIKERMDRYVQYLGEKFWSGKPLISAPYFEHFDEYFNRLYFNTAGREIGIQTMKCALTNISPKRLLFATDYPPNFVDDSIGMKTYIQKIRGLDLDKKSIDAILGKNAIELFHLNV